MKVQKLHGIKYSRIYDQKSNTVSENDIYKIVVRARSLILVSSRSTHDHDIVTNQRRR